MDRLCRSLFFNCFGFAFCILASPIHLSAQTRAQSALSYVELGVNFAHNGDFDRTISTYGIALQFAPDFALAYFKRVLAREAKEHFSGAISDYSKTIEHDPHCAAAFYNRGTLSL